jgi:hypothetical protein
MATGAYGNTSIRRSLQHNNDIPFGTALVMGLGSYCYTSAVFVVLIWALILLSEPFGLAVATTGTMMSSSRRQSMSLQRTTLFCHLSNLHDIDNIKAMLAEDCDVYGNKGPEAAAKGMQAFYRKYDSAYWIFNSMKPIREDAIEIGFNRYWRDKETSHVLMSMASEVIVFEGDLIKSITYSQLPTEPTHEESGFPSNMKVFLSEAEEIRSIFITSSGQDREL